MVPNQHSLRLHFSQMTWLQLLILERTGYTDVSVAINLYTVEFICNMNATQLFPNAILNPATGLFIVSFPLIYRKLSCSNIYKSCCYMGILIASLYPNIVLVNVCNCLLKKSPKGFLASLALLN